MNDLIEKLVAAAREYGADASLETANAEMGAQIDLLLAIANKDAEYNLLRGELALKYVELHDLQAEVERLRGIIRNVENLTFDWRGGECRNCCDTHPGEEHEPDCSFYQWEGGAK